MSSFQAPHQIKTKGMQLGLKGLALVSALGSETGDFLPGLIQLHFSGWQMLSGWLTPLISQGKGCLVPVRLDELVYTPGPPLASGFPSPAPVRTSKADFTL